MNRLSSQEISSGLVGWYYLHTNGDLIYKRELGDTAADIRESDFARGLWPCDPSDRAGAWRIAVEALASGADKKRIAELAEKWKLTDDDGHIYAERLHVKLARDGSHWCATRSDFENLQESPAGFGLTVLEALAELAKALGYQPSKMWGSTFEQLAHPDWNTPNYCHTCSPKGLSCCRCEIACNE